MPTFEIEAPDGRILEIEGDKMPSSQELDQIFKETSSNQEQDNNSIQTLTGGVSENVSHENFMKSYNSLSPERQKEVGPPDVGNQVSGQGDLTTAGLMLFAPELNLIKKAGMLPYVGNKLITGGAWGVGQSVLEKAQGEDPDILGNIVSMAATNAILGPILEPVIKGAKELIGSGVNKLKNGANKTLEPALDSNLTNEIESTTKKGMNSNKEDGFINQPLEDFNKNISDLKTQKEELLKKNQDPTAIDKQIKELSVQRDDYFEQNFKPTSQGSKIKASLRENVSNFMNKTFNPISTELDVINPKLKHALRRFEMDTSLKENEATKNVVPFQKKASKMSKKDYDIFDLALKNRETATVDYLVEKYNMKAEYTKVRQTLDSLHAQAKDTGIDLGHLDDYFPRKIINPTKFLQEIHQSENWSAIKNYLEKIDPDNVMNDSEKAQAVNNLLRGYGKDKITLSAPNSTKERTIQKISPNLNRHYKDSMISLTDYIRSMNENIQARKFFGKNEPISELNDINKKIEKLQTKLDDAKSGFEKNKIEEQIQELNDLKIGLDNYASKQEIDKNIGAYIKKLSEDGLINANDEQKVKDLLTARFNQKGTSGVVSTFKNFSYLTTMGNPISAITQLGDFSLTLYNNGAFDSFIGFSKQFSKSKISKQDLGIDKIAQEFSDESTTGKAVSSVFKAVGLDFMDKIGKETFINASFRKFKNLAKKDTPEFNEFLDTIFEKEANQVKEDLKTGIMSDNVKYLLFNDISDFQPISLTEMPQSYLTGGNSRVFYMLKTYTVKQFDIYRNEVFRQMKKDPVNATKNLVTLSASLFTMNMASDEIKDFILGRETEFSDIVVDNMLKLVGFSKWQLYKSKKDGLFMTTLQSILPPIPLLDSLYKDLSRKNKKQFRDFQSLKDIPVFGKFYYWWFGGGSKEGQRRVKNANSESSSGSQSLY